MPDHVGFVTMGEAGTPAREVPTLGIGMLGYAFMGKVFFYKLRILSRCQGHFCSF